MALDLGKIVNTAISAAGSSIAGLQRTVTYRNITNPTYSAEAGTYTGGQTTYTLAKCLTLGYTPEDKNQDTSSTRTLSLMIPINTVKFTPSTEDTFTVEGYTETWNILSWDTDPTATGYMLIKAKSP